MQEAKKGVPKQSDLRERERSSAHVKEKKTRTLPARSPAEGVDLRLLVEAVAVLADRVQPGEGGERQGSLAARWGAASQSMKGACFTSLE